MDSLRRAHITWIIGSLLILSIILAGCAPDATSAIISPELGERMIADAMDSAVEAVPEDEVAAAMLADLNDEEIFAGLSDEMMTALGEADPTNGETLALVNGCIGCHSLDPEAVMTGPTWNNVGNTAVGRIEGVSPAAYLHNSIMATNDFIVTDYPQSVMPQNYSETLSVGDQADLVAYLLQQQGAASE
jgi:cytochrome c551/c552